MLFGCYLAQIQRGYVAAENRCLYRIRSSFWRNFHCSLCRYQSGGSQRIIAEIGYTNTEYGFSAETVGVHPSLVEQSPDIAWRSRSIWGSWKCLKRIRWIWLAGDQGLSWLFVDETVSRSCRCLFSQLRKTGVSLAELQIRWIVHLRPDAKSQVTVVHHDVPIAQFVDTVKLFLTSMILEVSNGTGSVRS